MPTASTLLSSCMDTPASCRNLTHIEMQPAAQQLSNADPTSVLCISSSSLSRSLSYPSSYRPRDRPASALRSMSLATAWQYASYRSWSNAPDAILSSSSSRALTASGWESWWAGAAEGEAARELGAVLGVLLAKWVLCMCCLGCWGRCAPARSAVPPSCGACKRTCKCISSGRAEGPADGK